MYQLEEKIYFYILLVVPMLLLIYLGYRIWQKKAQNKFAHIEALQKLSPTKSHFKSALKLIILILTFVLLSIALVNPKIGTKLETIKREGIDIVFAIDVSKSMAAEDITPNRLDKSKRLVSEIINTLASDRIGIIAYAGQAYPQLPITTDYGAAKMFLQYLSTDMLSSQGTAINQAIDLSVTFYDDNEQTNRVLFLISDGEDHSEMAQASVEKAKKAGIKIYTIGVGTDKGGPIPIKVKGITNTYKKDRNGDVVITKLNEVILQSIANRGNGAYINGINTKETVALVTEHLATIDKTEFESKQFADYKDQFQGFIFVAIILLIIDVSLLDRKTSWVQKLNLFNERKK